eukprot:1326317-Rhodomonas_salina.1
MDSYREPPRWYSGTTLVGIPSLETILAKPEAHEVSAPVDSKSLRRPDIGYPRYLAGYPGIGRQDRSSYN